MRALPLLLIASFAISTAVDAAPPRPVPKRWSGTLVVPKTNLVPAAYEVFELEIWNVTTDEQLEPLRLAYREGGQEALRQAMFALEQKSWVRIGKGVASTVGVVRVIDKPDGGRIVRLFSDHPLRLLDKSDPVGTTAHPFAFVELEVDEYGVGEGKMIAAAALDVVDGDLVIQSAGLEGITIRDVAADLSSR
jgi:hypothetical protein